MVNAVVITIRTITDAEAAALQYPGQPLPVCVEMALRDNSCMWTKARQACAPRASPPARRCRHATGVSTWSAPQPRSQGHHQGCQDQPGGSVRQTLHPARYPPWPASIAHEGERTASCRHPGDQQQHHRPDHAHSGDRRDRRARYRGRQMRQRPGSGRLFERLLRAVAARHGTPAELQCEPSTGEPWRIKSPGESRFAAFLSICICPS